MLRILIVEDEPVIALDLQGIFEDAGHMVAGVAREMAGALRFAGASDVDLAVMDVDLACEPDGVEVARRLRSEHDVASLFVSAQLTDEVRARAQEWKPIGFIAKPFRESQVLDAIAPLLRANGAARA